MDTWLYIDLNLKVDIWLFESESKGKYIVLWNGMLR